MSTCVYLRPEEIKGLPISPRRLVKAAGGAGWGWDASHAASELDEIHVSSVAIRTWRSDVQISARWETIGEDTELSVCWIRYPGEWPARIGFNDAVAYIKANPKTVIPSV